MNTVDYLLDKVYQEIPLELLEMAFQPRYMVNRARVSLDHSIKSMIINKMLKNDTNMVYGIEAVIDIEGVPIEYVNMGMIYRVGLKPTGGRKISSVLSVGYGYNALAGGAASIASALTPALQTSDSRIQLIGDNNTIYVEGYIGVILTKLRCLLENDDDFNNINKRQLPLLSELCNLAVKSFIYKEITLKLRNATVVQGIDMAKIESMVDEYKDSYQMYMDLLTKRWVKASIMADPISRNRHIRRIMPG